MICDSILRVIDHNPVILGREDHQVAIVSMKNIIPVEEGDFYLSAEGYRVFTRQYHLKRGYCCQSACRHCPFGYDKKQDRC